MADRKEHGDRHRAAADQAPNGVVADGRPCHPRKQGESEHRQVQESLRHQKRDWQDPVRNRQQRDEEEKNTEAHGGPGLPAADGKGDRRSYEHEPKPRVPISQTGNRYRIEIVIAGDIDWGQQQLEIFQESAAGCQFALSERPVAFKVLCGSRHTQ